MTSDSIEMDRSEGTEPLREPVCRLTAGLIVKNEEKNLRACLTALRPLVDAVGGEILVTDTGSTDRTVEIAEELADRVLHFRWTDDFAAARNSALPHARGEWFLYLDGDEILDEDLSDVIAFFASGEERDYDSASLCQRNYQKLNETEEYGDYHAVRLFRRKPGLRFVGAVHESIPVEPPTRKLKLIAHHYGYAGMNEGLQEAKLERNRRILNRQSRDVRNRMLLADTYPQEPKKQLVYLREARDLAEAAMDQGLSETWRVAAYVRLARICYFHPEASGADELGETLRAYWAGKRVSEPYVGEMELSMYHGLYAYSRGETDDAIVWLETYLRLNLDYREGRLDTQDVHALTLKGDREINYCEAAVQLLEIYEEEGEREKAGRLLRHLLNLDLQNVSLKERVFYAGLREGASLGELADSMPVELLAVFVEELSRRREAFHGILREWLEGSGKPDTLSLLQLHWRICLTANGMICLCGQASESWPEPAGEAGALFEALCGDFRELFARMYQPEALAEEMLAILPDLHLAGIQGLRALEAKDRGDAVGYVRGLRETAEACPPMAEAMEVLARQAEEELRSAAESRREFELLAGQVKEQLSALVRQGKYEETQQILTVYRQINPGDAEAEALAGTLAEAVRRGSGGSGDSEHGED